MPAQCSDVSTPTMNRTSVVAPEASLESMSIPPFLPSSTTMPTTARTPRIWENPAGFTSYPEAAMAFLMASRSHLLASYRTFTIPDR